MSYLTEPSEATLRYIQAELPGATPEEQFEHAVKFQRYLNKWNLEVDVISEEEMNAPV